MDNKNVLPQGKIRSMISERGGMLPRLNFFERGLNGHIFMTLHYAPACNIVRTCSVFQACFETRIGSRVTADCCACRAYHFLKSKTLLSCGQPFCALCVGAAPMFARTPHPTPLSGGIAE